MAERTKIEAMSATNDPREINKRLCKLVGLNPRCVSSFTLRVSVDDYPQLVVNQYVVETDQFVDHEVVLTELRPRPPVDFAERERAILDDEAANAVSRLMYLFNKSAYRLGLHAPWRTHADQA